MNPKPYTFPWQDQVTKDYDAVVFDVLRVNAEDIAVSFHSI